MNLYLQCSLISLIGLALSVLAVINSLTTKAKVANVVFNWSLFFKRDIWIQVAGTLLTVALFLFLLDAFFKQFPKYKDSTLFILIFFAALGYLGSDVASRFFSVVNKRINNAIDIKTDISDQATGETGPTVAPKKSE